MTPSKSLQITLDQLDDIYWALDSALDRLAAAGIPYDSSQGEKALQALGSTLSEATNYAYGMGEYDTSEGGFDDEELQDGPYGEV